MLNQVTMVGRLVAKPIIKKDKNGRKIRVITLVVPRNFKNAYGIYDTDFINCILWSGIAENIIEYLEKGDILGVKGRLQCLSGNKLQVVAESISFLSSREIKGKEK